MPGSAGASSSGCVSAPRANIPTRSSQGALPRLARTSIEDVFAAVGRGEMKASDVARAMYPDYKEERVGDAARRSRRAAGSA